MGEIVRKYSKGKILIYHGVCLMCGACVGACPANAMMLDGATLKIQLDLCTMCMRCVALCPVGALSLEEIPA